MAFEPYKPLFDQEHKLLEGKGADEEWFAAYETIEGLAVTLRYPSQAKSTELFLLHIDGEMAQFKAVFDRLFAFPKAKAYRKLSF